MIKRFIDKVENLSTDAWVAILNYIDTNIDELQKRSKENEKTVNQLRKDLEELTDEFGDAKAIIDSNTELSKTIKKTAITSGVSVLVGYIAFKLGIVG